MKRINQLVLIVLFIISPILLTYCGPETFTVEPREDPRDIANELMSFTISDVYEAYASIDEDLKTVRLLFPFHCNVDLANITVDFEVPMRASCNMEPGTHNFTSPKALTITSVVGEENIYTVSAEICSGTALLISDTQNDIIPLYNQDEFFTKINTVIDKAHNAGIATYYIMITDLIEGSDSTKWFLPDELHRYDEGELVAKGPITNALDYTTGLHHRLLEKGIGKVVIVGVSSMGCVLGTCRGASALKYDVTLVRDAHGEPTAYREITAIELCNETYINEGHGQIITAEELTF